MAARWTSQLLIHNSNYSCDICINLYTISSKLSTKSILFSYRAQKFILSKYEWLIGVMSQYTSEWVKGALRPSNANRLYIDDIYIRKWDGKICCPGPDSSRISKYQHTEIPCHRLSCYPTQSYYNDTGLTSPALALKWLTLSRDTLCVKMFSLWSDPTGNRTTDLAHSDRIYNLELMNVFHML